MYTNMFAFGIVLVLISCLTDVSCQREKCFGSSNLCRGETRNTKAICKDGYCVCTGQHYDYNTCLRKLSFVLNKSVAKTWHRCQRKTHTSISISCRMLKSLAYLLQDQQVWVFIGILHINVEENSRYLLL